MRCITWLGAGSTLALLILAMAAPAEGEGVRLNMVPLPVLDAVRTRFKDARLTGADKEVQDGKTIYEIAIKHQGRNIDVTLTPEGAILLIKKDRRQGPTRAGQQGPRGHVSRGDLQGTRGSHHGAGSAREAGPLRGGAGDSPEKTVEVKVSAEGEIVK